MSGDYSRKTFSPLRDFSGDLWHLPGFFVVLLDEGIDIAQGVGNVHKRQTDRADPRAFCHSSA